MSTAVPARGAPCSRPARYGYANRSWVWKDASKFQFLQIKINSATHTERKLDAMDADRATLVRFAIYVALYVACAELAVLFLAKPTDVTLIWPSAGVAYAVILHHGLRWWPVIAAGVLLLHLLVSPAPPAFVPFSLLSNIAATLLAGAFVASVRGRAPMRLDFRDGFLVLGGAAVIALVGAPIGAFGMYVNGMTSADTFWFSLTKWAAGDIFGIVALTPVLLMIMGTIDAGRVTRPPKRFPAIVERSLWMTASVLGGGLLVHASEASPAYALGLSFIPLTLLLWSALRFEPIFTAGATGLFALTVVSLIGLSVGGFSAPSGSLETIILIALLTTMAIVPQLVATANYRLRTGAQELLKRARTDHLTGLPNRTAFDEQLAQTLLRRGEIGNGGALGYIDIDQFKLINDTASHAAGDEAIRQLSSVLRASLPANVELARFGADEFGVLWPDADAATVDAQARELRLRIAGFRFPSGDRIFAVTASIGIAPFPTRTASSTELLAQADSACYVAKELGGNRVHTHRANDTALIERTAAMEWVVRLNDALENDRFELYGQKILYFAEPALIAYEVLLRLHGPDGERVMPNRFIPAAERFSMASRIDRHVFDRALRWLESESTGGVRLNINLSASTLADEDFAHFLRQRLKSSHVDPSQICIEITETSAVRDLTHARKFISQFKEMGLRFALDDFGAGFCSFAYLRDLDVDIFKIDGSFVRDLHNNELSLAIVRSIVEIARVLGKRTVGEAVEDTATGRRLKELGVDGVQGYAYHRPEPLGIVHAQAA